MVIQIRKVTVTHLLNAQTDDECKNTEDQMSAFGSVALRLFKISFLGQYANNFKFADCKSFMLHFTLSSNSSEYLYTNSSCQVFTTANEDNPSMT